MTRAHHYLLDANIIVYSYQLDIWEDILDNVQVVTPASIVQDEAKFYSEEYKQVMIDLPKLVRQKRLKQIDPSLSQVTEVIRKFDCSFSKRIHKGEKHMLAHALAYSDKNIHLCSGDKAALMALAMLGLDKLAISLEQLLKKIGYQKTVDPQYTESFLKESLEEGKQNRIIGRGLTDSDSMWE